MQEIARKRQNHLAQVNAQLVETMQVAPRPLLQRMCTLVDEATRLDLNAHHPLKDDVPLTMGDLELLDDLYADSWSLDVEPYGDHLAGFPENQADLNLEMAKLREFERDVMSATIEGNETRSLLPFWDPPPLPRSERADPNSDDSLAQRPYDKNVASRTGISVEGQDPQGLIFRINNQRQERAGEDVNVHHWSSDEVQHYLRAMHDSGRIQ